MKTPHKHAALIHAWADGAEIEYQIQKDGDWYKDPQPRFLDIFEYRIKPEQKPDHETKYMYLNWQDGQNEWFITAAPFTCTKLKFKAEVL